MFNQLTDNLKCIIYEYDPTYKHIYNVVLEEFKIKCILKHKPQFNNNNVKEWRDKLAQTEEEQVNITLKHNLLDHLHTQIKQAHTHETLINFVIAINRPEYKGFTYIIIPQLRPTPTAFGISIFNII